MTVHRATVAYSLCAYLLFTAVSAYAIGFFADLVTPTTLDGTRTQHAAMAAAVDLLLVLAFSLQHSVMARASFKRVWTRVVPGAAERSTYVLIASLLLGVLMWQWQPIGPSLYRLHGGAAAVLLLLQGMGWLVVVGSTYLVDHAELFGLTWTRSAAAISADLPALVERSAYRYVRHPLMTGFLIVFWAAPHLTVGHLLLALLCTLYVLVGTALEERDLRARFGAEYDDYAARVPAFLPVGAIRRRSAARRVGA